jgi:hypothetical protein
MSIVAAGRAVPAERHRLGHYLRAFQVIVGI